MLATTATANQRVVDDVADQLAIGADGTTHDVLVLRGTLERESLRLGVLRLGSSDQQLGWLAEHLDDLPGSGIIYTLTVAGAEDLAAFLRAAGHDVVAYSGRTDTAERLEAEAALVENRVKALVATSALGMGFDKPDLGFVVHVGAPQSPIAYYQQVGRAGRAVERADVLLLPGARTRRSGATSARWRSPRRTSCSSRSTRSAAAGRPLSTAALETRTPLRRGPAGDDAQGARRRRRGAAGAGGWIATGQPWTYDRERYRRVAQAREDEQQAMRRYLAGGSCRMEMLRRDLDDPFAEPCGRCDECAGAWYPTEVSEQAVATARDAIDRPGVDLEARTQWPTGMAALGVDVKGKIAADEQMADGRAVARLSDIGWGTRLRELVGPGAADDAPVTPAVVNAVVAVLKTWGWLDRPVAVVAMPSRTRPQLIASLAERIAVLGKLELLGSLAYAHGGPTGGHGGNSAHRLAAVWERVVVPAGRGVGAGAAARAGAPRRRRRRLPLDAHRRRPGAAPGRRDGGPPARPGHRRLTPSGLFRQLFVQDLTRKWSILPNSSARIPLTPLRRWGSPTTGSWPGGPATA